MNNIENNKLIAEFMGLTLSTDGENAYKNGHHYIGVEGDKNLYYDKNWNDLMVVVDSIERFGIVHIMNNRCIIYVTSVDKYLSEFIVNGYVNNDYRNCKNKREAVYKACIEFIKWYNE